MNCASRDVSGIYDDREISEKDADFEENETSEEDTSPSEERSADSEEEIEPTGGRHQVKLREKKPRIFRIEYFSDDDEMALRHSG